MTHDARLGRGARPRPLRPRRARAPARAARRLGPELHRHEDRASRHVLPRAAEPAAAFRLMIGHDRRALRVVVAEQPLRRLRTTRRSDTGVRACRGAAAARPQESESDTPTRLARVRKSRPIRLELRRDSALAYEKLSDPILVKRAKDGDRQALEALLTRHAPRVERLALHFLAIPRTRATRPRRRSPSSASA